MQSRNPITKLTTFLVCSIDFASDATATDRYSNRNDFPMHYFKIHHTYGFDCKYNIKSERFTNIIGLFCWFALMFGVDVENDYFITGLLRHTITSPSYIICVFLPSISVACMLSFGVPLSMFDWHTHRSVKMTTLHWIWTWLG